MTNVENASLTSHPPLTPRSTRELPTFAPTELQRSNSNASHVSMPSVSARRMSRLSTGDALSNSALLSARGSERGKNRSISNASLSTRQRYNAVSPRSAVDVLQQWQVQGNAMKVYVRVRPFSEREIAQRLPAHSTVRIDSENPSLITILDPTREFRPVATYSFTRCFWSVFEKSASTLQAAKTMSEMRDTVDTYLHGGMNSAIRSHVQPSPTTPRAMDSARNRSSRDLARNESVPAYTGAGSNAALADANVSHPPYAGQEEVYRYIGKPILENTLDGYNGCVFAYGQTGSGKTFTMLGYAPRTAEIRAQRSRRESMALPNSSSVNVTTCEEIVSPASDSAAFERQVSPQVIALGSEDGDDVVDKASLDPNDLQGIIPRISADLFAGLRAKREKDASCSYRVEVMYYEIYNEKVFDLVRPQRNAELKIRHNPTSGPYVDGLTNKVVVNEEDVARVLRKGMQERHTAATKFNDRSSRSHAILSFNIVQVYLDGSDNTCKMQSKLNLVDLAGSERTGAAGAEGHELTDGIKINLSLTVLGRVIDCLADLSQNKSLTGPVPYRDSNLTWLLSDSLGGNSQTSMIATISPHMINFEEMRQTIRYASRAKQIMNRAVRNEDPQVRQIKLLMSEVERLNQLLAEAGGHEYTREYVKDLEKRVRQLEKKCEEQERTIGNLRAELERAGLPDPTLVVAADANGRSGRGRGSMDEAATAPRLVASRAEANAKLRASQEQITDLTRTATAREWLLQKYAAFVRSAALTLGNQCMQEKVLLFAYACAALAASRDDRWRSLLSRAEADRASAVAELERSFEDEKSATTSRQRDALNAQAAKYEQTTTALREQLALAEARLTTRSGSFEQERQRLNLQLHAVRQEYEAQLAQERARMQEELNKLSERLRGKEANDAAQAARTRSLQQMEQQYEQTVRRLKEENGTLRTTLETERVKSEARRAAEVGKLEKENAELLRQRRVAEDELGTLRTDKLNLLSERRRAEQHAAEQMRDLAQHQDSLVTLSNLVVADYEASRPSLEANMKRLRDYLQDKDYASYRERTKAALFGAAATRPVGTTPTFRAVSDQQLQSEISDELNVVESLRQAQAEHEAEVQRFKQAMFSEQAKLRELMAATAAATSTIAKTTATK